MEIYFEYTIRVPLIISAQSQTKASLKKYSFYGFSIGFLNRFSELAKQTKHYNNRVY